LAGCQASRRVSVSDIEKRRHELELVSVKHKNGELIDFSEDPPGFAVLRDSVIVRDKRHGSMELIPVNQVDIMSAYRRSTATEDATSIGLVTLTGLVLGVFFLSVLEFPHF